MQSSLVSTSGSTARFSPQTALQFGYTTVQVSSFSGV